MVREAVGDHDAFRILAARRSVDRLAVAFGALGFGNDRINRLDEWETVKIRIPRADAPDPMLAH